MTHLNKIHRHFEFYDDGCAEDAPVVLMLPGVSCGAALWREAIPYFLPNYKLLMFNNPGLNNTSMPLILSIEGIVDRVKAVLDHLNIEKVHIIGHSMGGFTAQRFTLQYPEMVEKLVLVSTSYGGPHTQKYASDMAHEGFERAFGNAPSLKEDPENGYKLIFSEDYLEKHPLEYKRWAHHMADINSEKATTLRHFACGSLFSSYGEVHKIDKQTLVIHGQDDKLVRPDGGDLLAGQINGAHILRIEKCGHMPMYEREDFYPRVIDFLEGSTVGELAPNDEPGQQMSHFDHTIKTYALGFERLMDMAKKKF